METVDHDVSCDVNPHKKCDEKIIGEEAEAISKHPRIYALVKHIYL
jgi:hypothetical protein